MSQMLRVARAALHRWEEPCISGRCGSGAVFFSGCVLRCVFCQNRRISAEGYGKNVTPKMLAGMMLDLQEQGAHNINLVTPTHFAEGIRSALMMAREQGMSLPVVYNCGGYEDVAALRRLEGLVDVWLPDFKYLSAELAARYSRKADYPERAKAALSEMVRQSGTCCYDAEGMMTKGVLVRHLVLPGHTKEAKAVLHFLFSEYGNRIAYSILNQYTPMPYVAAYAPELNRRLTKREYERVAAYAVELGIENGYLQEGSAARESFIPAFDGTGV
ncbi:MAG: radical SAM protein [bacterium]|nr:radical SAM protein [bacterium]